MTENRPTAPESVSGDVGRRTTHRTDGGTAAEKVVVLNPTSGDGQHAGQVRELAAEYGFAVRETAGEGDAVDLAAEAATGGAEVVAAAGGDGTLNEAVQGLIGADALGDVLFGVVPAGTGNDFAENVGIESIPGAFEVLADGDRRVVDLGFADERPFLNSCIGGLTAEASDETSSAGKARFGVLAYVLSTLQTAIDFEGVALDIEVTDEADDSWRGSALLLLVGNGRRFPSRGATQADMEDGLLDVAIVEEHPGSDFTDLARSTALERLFAGGSDAVRRLQAPELTVVVRDEEPATFSLDGEMTKAQELTLETRPGALELCVGDAYDAHP